MGSRRSNCYLNSAYNRNLDDYDDYVDSVSQRSFDVNSCRRLYESDTEAYYGGFESASYYEDDHTSGYSNDNRLAAFDESQIDNRSYSLQQLQRYHKDAVAMNSSNVERYVLEQQRLTSTPKKYRPTPAHLKNPQRRQAIVRHHSFSALSRREFAGAAAAAAATTVASNGNVERDYRRSSVAAAATLRRSRSSLSLRPSTFNSFDRGNRYAMVPTSSVPIDAGYSSEADGRILRRVVSNNRDENNAIALPIRRMSPPPSVASTVAAVHSVSPFQIRQKSDDFSLRNPFLRRPYPDLNSSFSSSRPLVSDRQPSSRNTAVISPIYNKKCDYTSCSVVSVADHSNCSSNKSTSWLQTRAQTLPLCTLRTSAGTLLISGGLTCLLCIALMSQRGKSYELTLSLICGFVIFCLGLPCFRFEHWQWIPNRNYVSGYVILSLFSLLQLGALWMLNRYSDLRPEWMDVTKGALCGISILSLSMAFFGVCASCCCKYPPPDNRVTHGVQGFTV